MSAWHAARCFECGQAPAKLLILVLVGKHEEQRRICGVCWHQSRLLWDALDNPEMPGPGHDVQTRRAER